MTEQERQRQIRMHHIDDMHVIKDLINLGRKNDALTYIHQRIKALQGK